RPRHDRRQEHHPPRPPFFGDQRQIHPARRVRHADEVLGILAGRGERLHETLGVPRGAFVGACEVEGRSHDGVAASLKDLGDQAPALGALAAAVDEEVREHRRAYGGPIPSDGTLRHAWYAYTRPRLRPIVSRTILSFCTAATARITVGILSPAAGIV